VQGCVLRLNSCEVYKSDFKNICPVVSQYQHLIEMKFFEIVFSVLLIKVWREEVERDVQVMGVRSWRELVIDREKLRGFFRQATAHSGL